MKTFRDKAVQGCLGCGVLKVIGIWNKPYRMGKMSNNLRYWFGTDKFEYWVYYCLACHEITISKFYVSNWPNRKIVHVTLKDKRMLGGLLPQLREKILSCAKK